MSALNIPAILARIEAAEITALDEVASFVAADARHRAPIRKVFREAPGFRRKFRALTPQERNLAIRRAQAYKGYTDFARRRSVAHIRNYARAEVPRRGSANSLSRSRNLRVLGQERVVRLASGESQKTFTPRVDAVRVRSRGRTGYTSDSLSPLLTSRGRYEVSSGRAIHSEVLRSGAVRVHVGGALKASIGAEDVVQTEAGATIKVTAGIRYAKFVEFPTTHNASQPFLLPALHDARGRLRSAVAREVKKALGG